MICVKTISYLWHNVDVKFIYSTSLEERHSHHANLEEWQTWMQVRNFYLFKEHLTIFFSFTK